MPSLTTYRPSQVLRLVKAGKLSDSQPGLIFCAEHGHPFVGVTTESPTFWENGSYCWCQQCGHLALARPRFATFDIDLSGERKKYPFNGDLT